MIEKIFFDDEGRPILATNFQYPDDDPEQLIDQIVEAKQTQLIIRFLEMLVHGAASDQKVSRRVRLWLHQVRRDSHSDVAEQLQISRSRVSQEFLELNKLLEEFSNN